MLGGRIHAGCRAEVESLNTEVAALKALVEVLRPLAESDPCWTIDSVCGYCSARAGDGDNYHQADCEWVLARAALAAPETEAHLARGGEAE